jgi:CheY-like chemotaxis protein
MTMLDLTRLSRIRLAEQTPANALPPAPPFAEPVACPTGQPRPASAEALTGALVFEAVPSAGGEPNVTVVVPTSAPPPDPIAPPVPDPPPAALPEAAPWTAPAVGVDPQTALSRPGVLVADDNVRLARAVAAYMEMEGFRAETAHSAEEALEAAERSPFELALVDINMPGIDGIEVCRRLREMSPGVRVLIVTGRDSDDDPHRAAAAGARRLLTKPISLSALRDEMLRVLAEQVP